MSKTLPAPFQREINKAATHTRHLVEWTNAIAKRAALFWVVGVALIYYLAGPMPMVDTNNPNYKTNSLVACSSANLTGICYLCAIYLYLIQFYSLETSHWSARFGNGGFNVVLVLLSICAVTDLLMANFPTPVIFDRTGVPIHLMMQLKMSLVSATLIFLLELLDASTRTWKKKMWISVYVFAAINAHPIRVVLISLVPFVHDCWVETVLGKIAGVTVASVLVLLVRRYLQKIKWINANLVTEVQKTSFVGRLILNSNKLRFYIIALAGLVFLNYHVIFRPEVRRVVYLIFYCLAVLFFTSVLISQYDLCFNQSKLIEDGFANMGAELNLIWNHSSDVLVVITKTKKASLDHLLYKEKHMDASTTNQLLSNVTVHSSPSLVGLTGGKYLENLELGERFHDISRDSTKVPIGRSTLEPSGLEICLRKAWERRLNDNPKDHNGHFNFTCEFTLAKIVADGNDLDDKECELVVSKIFHVDGSITMIAVARDISNRSKEYMLDFEREKNLIARETAHTVKNLNTTAHHKLIEVLEGFENFAHEVTELGKLHNLPPMNALYRKHRDTALATSTDHLRQALAIMMTAAQQSYQLSRVGEILRGEPAHLTAKV